MKKLVIAFMLVISLLLTSGCTTVVDGIRSIFDENDNHVSQMGENGYLSLYSLIQKLVDSIRSENELTTAFSSIPERQRDGISLDLYEQYIRLIRRAITGEIGSFSVMSDDDIALYQEEMLIQRPDQADLIQSLTGVWLYFRETGRQEEKYPIFLETPDDGPALLSHSWVEQTQQLADVSSLYFDAIDRSDQEALAVLLQIAEPDKPLDLMKIKAARIISFYQDSISTRTTEFKVLQARMDTIVYEAFGIIQPNQNTAVSRTIELKSKPQRGYEINDTISDNLREIDLSLFFSEQFLFRFAAIDDDGQLDQIRSNYFESLVGTPFEHTDENCSTVGNIQRLELEYEMLDLIVEGSCFRHSRWDGVVQNIVIHSPMTRLGSGLRPGQSVYEILRRYPFADETDYIIQSRFNGYLVKIAFEITNENTIDAISLTLQNR